MKKFYCSLICLLLNYSIGIGQTIIKGEVVDASTNEPLIGASVFFKNTNNHTHSDINGAFSITQKDTSLHFLEVTYLGYTSKSVELTTDQSFYRVLLNPNILDEVVLIGFRPPFAENAQLLVKSTSTAFVTDQDLANNDGTAITPILNSVPGIFMHSGALNTNRITIRGIGARSLFATTKLRAYLNDIPLTTGDGETTIEDIDLQLIDEVEIIKGPAASAYGTGLGGTLLLKAPQFTRISSGFHSQLTVGSFGLIRNLNELVIRGKGGWLSLNHNLTHSDGYRMNNTYDRQSFNLLSDWSIGEEKRLKLSFIGNYIDTKAFIPSSLDSATYVNNPTSAAFTWAQTQGNEAYEKGLFGINGEYQADDVTFHTSLFYAFRAADEVRPFNILEEKSNTLGIRLRVETPNYEDKFKINVGGEGFIENYDWQTYENESGNQGTTLSNNEEQRYYFNLFSTFQYRISKEFIATGGFNLNKTNYSLVDNFQVDSLNQSGDYTFESILSPSIGLVYQIPMANKIGELSLFGNISHGFSPPSLSETLTPDGQINPDIQPEKGWSYEMGLRGMLDRYQNVVGLYHFYMDITAFSMRVKDLLVARRTANDAYIGINAGETLHNGLEFTLRYFPFMRKKYDLELEVNYTLADYKFTDFVDDADDFSSNALTGVPTNVLNGELNFSYNVNTFRFYTHVRYQFVDEIPLRDDNSLYSTAYEVVNAKAGFIIIHKKMRFDAFVGINNLLDEKYAAMLLINAGSFGGQAPRYYYPGLPRHYYGGVRLGYWF